MKVLLALNHAPDYREPFFRELGNQVDLTVIAQPCPEDNLTPPEERVGYKIYEIPTYRLKGLFWQPGLSSILGKEHWDIICFDLNPRQLSWIVQFLMDRKLWKKWVWRGRFFGGNTSSILDNFRKHLIKRSAGCLTYNEPIAQRIRDEYKVDAVSFNNTQVCQADFRPGVFPEHSGIRLLFVGRNQPRKRLQRLIELAARRQDIHIRLIGPGMESLEAPSQLVAEKRVQIYGRLVGDDLNEHFDWTDLVCCPGDVGLLVMHAAQNGKGIVIDANSNHGPEYWLAQESGQPFVDFSKQEDVDSFLDHILVHKQKLLHFGETLQNVAREQYTIEYMAKIHHNFFQKVISCSKKH